MSAEAAAIAAIGAQVEEHQELLERIVGLLATAGGGPMPARWLVPVPDDATDDEKAAAAEDARDAWLLFVEWVVALQRRYQLPSSKLPKCWWRHPAAVEELAALWISHRNAYRTGEHAPVIWHDTLDRVLHRIGKVWVLDCATSGEHQDTKGTTPWDLTDYAEPGAAGPGCEHPALPGTVPHPGDRDGRWSPAPDTTTPYGSDPTNPEPDGEPDADPT